MNTIRIATLVGLLAATSTLTACGKKEEAPPNTANNFNTGNNGMPPGADPAPNNGYDPNAQQQTGTDPNAQQQQQQQGIGGTAQAIDPTLAAVATTALGNLASTHAPGASPIGQVMAGNFQEGQTLEQSFNLEPGKCYTVVGSGVGMQKLDAVATAVTPLPGLSPEFGRASSTNGVAGPQVVLGSKDKCLRAALSPIAIPTKITITASKGAGLAAAQIYAK